MCFVELGAYFVFFFCAVFLCVCCCIVSVLQRVVGVHLPQLLAMVSQPRAARDNGPGNHLCKRFTITLLHST